MATEQPNQTNELLNTSSELRNLTISTPSNNTEIEHDIQKTDDSIIKDENGYIAIIDNKRLNKIAQINPNKTYNRIQTKNLNKFKATIHSTMQTVLERKRKKLENDANENKLEIIEKALNACYIQLIYFNKLFLNPVQNVNNIKTRNEEEISAEKQGKRIRINLIKAETEEKRKLLIQRIQALHELRNGTKQMTLNIPQNVKQKMKRHNLDTTESKESTDAEKQEKTQRILTMINNNKKNKMMELKTAFDELKENEMRLKTRTERIKNDEEKLKMCWKLREKNRMNRVSMASSIESTIHGPISPLMLQKLDGKGFKNVSGSKIDWNDIEL